MKYEYTTRITTEFHVCSKRELEYLNKMGEDDWELVAVIEESPNVIVYYFKRVKA